MKDVDPFLCTHVIYAFAKVQGNTVQPYEWNDMPDWGKSISSHSFTNIQTNPYIGVVVVVIRLDLQLPVQTVPITSKVVSSNSVSSI